MTARLWRSNARFQAVLWYQAQVILLGSSYCLMQVTCNSDFMLSGVEMHLVCISFAFHLHLLSVNLRQFHLHSFSLIFTRFPFHPFALDDLVARMTICEWPLRP